jgi:hypothetical protein
LHFLSAGVVVEKLPVDSNEILGYCKCVSLAYSNPRDQFIGSLFGHRRVICGLTIRKDVFCLCVVSFLSVLLHRSKKLSARYRRLEFGVHNRHILTNALTSGQSENNFFAFPENVVMRINRKHEQQQKASISDQPNDNFDG